MIRMVTANYVSQYACVGKVQQIISKISCEVYRRSVSQPLQRLKFEFSNQYLIIEEMFINTFTTNDLLLSCLSFVCQRFQNLFYTLKFE